MTGDDDERALIPRPRGGDVSLADDLASADRDQLVHVDARGQVRSPRRFHAINAAAYTVGGAASAWLVFLGIVGGPVTTAISLGFVGVFSSTIARVRRLNRAAQWMVEDRVEDAIPVLEGLAAARVPPRRAIRAFAEQHLGECHARRGRHAEALAHQRRALARWGARRRAPMARACELAEIVTLVNLGRTDEARRLADERRPAAPEGDWLELLRSTSELYVAFAEGDHRLDDDELHARARTALAVSRAAALLALTAWAHHRRGDEDQAWHLLREALDRRAGLPIAQTMPRLHAWIEAHADAARAAAPDDY